MEIKKVVIPVAGKGTRFLPATKEIPKEMIPILNRPMIHYAVEEAHLSGIQEVIFIISEGKESILKYFAHNKTLEKFLWDNGKKEEYHLINKIGSMITFSVVIQEEQLGLGHAILCAEKEVGGEPFAVILGDDLILGENPVTYQLIKQFQQLKGKSVIGVMEINPNDTEKYGVISGKKLDENHNTYLMDSMIEKPHPSKAPSNLATPGRYVFTSEIFNCLKEIKPGVGGEYQLTDAINLLAKKDQVFGHKFIGDRFDTGNLENYLEATIEFALRETTLKSKMISIIRNTVEKYNLLE